MGRNKLVVVDPVRNLGQPTVTHSGIPTRVLANSVKANQGSIESVAHWFEVAPEEVKDAVELKPSFLPREVFRRYESRAKTGAWIKRIRKGRTRICPFA